MSELIGGSPGRPQTAAKSSASSRSSSSSVSSSMGGFTGSGPVSIPASSSACRTAAATAGAPGVSPWTQIVSKRPDRASRTACVRGVGPSRTAPGCAARREAAVGQQQPVGEALAIDRDPGALGRGTISKPGWQTSPTPCLARHPRDRVGGVGVALAPVIQGAVRLDVGDRRDRREARDLKRDQRLDLLRRQRRARCGRSSARSS